ncbi:MAG: ABC transporter ATP-binding protein [Dermatophilaceae bacterium]
MNLRDSLFSAFVDRDAVEDRMVDSDDTTVDFPAEADGVVVVARGLTVSVGDTVILPTTDFALRRGEVLAVMGPSGSGKTTLLRCVTGLVGPSGGSVSTLGVDLGAASESERARHRRTRIGLMFQDPELLPELTVGENVALLGAFDGVPRSQALRDAEAGLAEVGLHRRAGDRVGVLSRGEAQRVALARALARDSMALLVADEPTASLDAATGAGVVELVLERVRALGAAAMIATHDAGVAARCDRVHVVGAGVGS